MKVLMPVLHYHPVIGGLETWTHNIAERLSDKAEVFIVTGKVRSQPKENNRGGLKIIRTSFFTLSDLSRSPKAYIITALPFIFLKSWAVARREKINVLHCQGFLSSLIGICLSALTGIPYIVTVQRLEQKGNLLKNFVYRKADFCIAASRAIKKNFEEVGVKKIEIIPNGIDMERFEGLQQKPHDRFTVITVARLEKVKGVEYLIGAAENFRLLIIGDGSERKRLEGLASELSREENVEFFGQVSNEKIPEYLMEANCFCLPSLKEGFGIAVLEAQAAGLPVIGTKVGGILDIIEDGKNGLLVEPGSAEEIQKAVARIQSNPKMAEALVKNAKEGLKKYNWQNIADRVYEIYHKVA